jgi:hypothetical protein
MLNANLPFDSEFNISFDKRIFIDTIAGFIEISPSISFTVIPDLIARNNARLIFNQKPEWDKSYTLKLKNGITDTFGNKTETDFIYPIIFNAEKNRPVTYINGVLDNIGVGYKFINSESDYSTLTLDITYFDPSGNEERSTELYYAFCVSAEADNLSLASAMQAISISTRNSCAEISIRTMKILTSTDPEFNTIYSLLDDGSGGNICILKIGIDVKNRDNRGLIIFSIRNDIADNLGNTMIASLNFTLNKQ